MRPRGLVLIAVLALQGCGDDEAGPGPTDAGTSAPRDASTNGSVADAGPGSGEDAGRTDGEATTPPTSGLDERPDNPTCIAPPRPATSNLAIRAAPAFPDLPRLSRPLMARPSPATGDDTWYAIEQAGRMVRFAPDDDQLEVVLDLRDQVDSSGNEEGLLGFAFHPEFGTNRRLFISYTGFDQGQPRSLVSELSVDAEGVPDPSSEQVILSLEKPFENHNGGHVEFGPDGRLYIATGDGGSGGDPLDNGQNPNTLLGAILRIDVDGGSPYAVPADNPFADGEAGRPEIWAYGLRNPWRFSFDRVTGGLWAGDVGQNRWEEIDLIEAGGNYGWNEREGFECFRPGCEQAGLIDPVAVYGRTEGRSITGGYVYRGQALPELEGAYIYADFVSGRVWALRADPDSGEYASELLFTASNVASFTEDDAGELYFMELGSGRFFRLERDGDPPQPGAFPERLSETGCFDPDDPSVPAGGLVPYAPTSTLWSDGTDKARWAALPNGTAATFEPDGDLSFPVGTVLAKTFLRGATRVETRLFVRHEDGGWAGYSYAWDEAQTDALLVADQAVVDHVDPPWLIPSRAQCMQCHTEAAGFSLGLEAAQLTGTLRYPSTGRNATQLSTWTEVGLVEGAPPPVPALVDPADEGAPVAARARAYLHVNCANCHQPGGPGRGDLDLRFTTPLAETGACDVPPIHSDLGLDDARIVAPGAPERSTLWVRMGRRDAAGMPPLATEVVDPIGTAVVRAWTRELSSCD